MCNGQCNRYMILWSLQLSVTLTELDLSWNGLGLEGCESLAEFLKVNTALRRLDISSNRIVQHSFRILVKGLIKNHTLQHIKVLRISYCTSRLLMEV